MEIETLDWLRTEDGARLLVHAAQAWSDHPTDPVRFQKSLRVSIEHGHDNNLTLDLATVAYWYQTEPHKAFPAFPDRESRKLMPNIGPSEIHRWRDAWRKQMGGGSQLWGNEKATAPPR